MICRSVSDAHCPVNKLRLIDRASTNSMAWKPCLSGVVEIVITQGKRIFRAVRLHLGPRKASHPNMFCIRMSDALRDHQRSSRIYRMDQYQTLIDQEKAKIELLKKKIRECESRIAALSTFLGADEFDSLLTRSLIGANEDEAATATVAAPPEQQLRGGAWSDDAREGTEDPKKALSPSVMALLEFIGEGKTIDQMEEFIRSRGDSMSRGALRTFIWNYRSKYGFLGKPVNGVIFLTGRGIKYLSSQKTALAKGA